MAKADVGGIRAISRGIAVLRAINQSGPSTMMEISRQTNTPYPTTCRIVETLLDEGLVEREPARKRYRATRLVRTLAAGYQSDQKLVTICRPHMVALTRKVQWPVTLSGRVGHQLMILDSTHSTTSLTFANYPPGFLIPMSESAGGKIYMAFADDEERAALAVGMRLMDGPEERLAVTMLDMPTSLNAIREEGYATQARSRFTSHPGKTSSLAVPLRVHGKIQASLSLIFFAAAIPMTKAIEALLPLLKATADGIERDLAAADA